MKITIIIMMKSYASNLISKSYDNKSIEIDEYDN